MGRSATIEQLKSALKQKTLTVSSVLYSGTFSQKMYF